VSTRRFVVTLLAILLLWGIAGGITSPMEWMP
jgi:hypothetical protein